MASKEHVHLIDRGVVSFNKWRDENPDAVIDLRDADMHGKDLRSINLSHAILEGADLSHALLSDANLSFAKLRKANLSHADMDRTDLSHGDLKVARFALAHLRNAVFFYAKLRGADLRGADLRHASLEDADLSLANLTHANLEGAVLTNASLKNAQLSHTCLNGVDLSAANLEGTDVSSVTFDRKSPAQFVLENSFMPGRLWDKRFDIILGTSIRCKGVRESCYGSRRFKKFIHDLDYLEEIMEARGGKALLFIWWLVSDCGRSISRWSFCSGMLVMLFAIIYYFLGPPHFQIAFLPFGFLTTVYYSVVTFTTLGFGDFVPKTYDAAVFVMIEVISGYIMLGGLISIFSNKLARRGN
ncbi:MAG: ion transport 2 domain protein [Deltaproteobacteria bacterium]|nr:ion transport 2 domain protein [Deltaproteobacteria bacterium]